MPSGIYKHKPCSEETKKRISETEKGKIVSLETRLKIRKTCKGRHQSPSTEFKKGDNKGPKHHNWQGGRSRWHKEGYYTPRYIKWREKVFKRDGYICQGCKKPKQYITAHHIKSWAHYPKLRFVVSNGQTLCEDCHKKTDNYKGRNKKVRCHHR